MSLSCKSTCTVSGNQSLKKVTKKRPSETSSCPHDIAKDVIFEVLGNPADLEDRPCDIELRHQVYVNEEISWVFWKSRQSYKYKVL